MSARYAPLPNPHTNPNAVDEMEAAFNDSDDDEDHRPLSTARNGYHSLPNAEPPAVQESIPAVPGAYDFENVDYDYTRPPPGSPPGPSSRALPNEFGNSNGLVPSFSSLDVQADAERGGWFRRTAVSILPTHYVRRWGLAPEVPNGAVGGGIGNDGVFANVTAKPTRPIRIQDGDETYLVPEEAQKDAPPSYATAQADAVPPYWETTIHAPSSANSPGEIIIDSLPTGSLFSFLWNMLVSISFQFVGFLLTYLLHTTHAAKLGSRAGLGITLIQYGFAMRGRDDLTGDQSDSWADPKPSFETAAEAEAYYRNLNATATAPVPSPTSDNAQFIVGDATTEWLSFLLMTVGWFILLTSLLGFWRVKRWERGILSSQQDVPPVPSQDQSQGPAIIRSFERLFGVQGLADGPFLRTSFGFPGAMQREVDEEVEQPSGAYILPLVPDDPDRNQQIARAVADEARLHQDLRSAGLL
ncbi:Metal homeostatis protein BSD2 [Grifola frondosa]|uniref:Metal homeostatis protein BSD2 n=1 Tax=Grifola frondosa TaxID=5627 RepID=A0A1C7MID8_GRIFR|nr:Metal homeostatis protein BSD2 [Grifola frondosa]